MSKPLVISILAKSQAHILPLYLKSLMSQNINPRDVIFYIRTNDNRDNTSDILRDWCQKWSWKWRIVFDESSIDESLTNVDNHDWTYNRLKILGSIRQASIDFARSEKADYFVADIDNIILPHTISSLRNTNLPVVAPLLNNTDITSLYGNYHSAIDQNGYFEMDDRYLKLFYQEYKGLIQVPVVHCTYFIKNEVLPFVTYDDNSGRYEYVIFSDSLRKANIPQYLDTREIYGKLTFASNIDEYNKNYLIEDSKGNSLERIEEYINKSLPIEYVS